MKPNNGIQAQVWMGMSETTLNKLKEYTNTLNNTIQKDNGGRPLHVLNIDVLIDKGISMPIKTLIDRPPDGLYIPISFSEGYPTINGIALWEKLEGEPLACYNLFQEYRIMRTTKKIRSIMALAELKNISSKTLEQYKSIFNWTNRIQAYEEFRLMEREMLLEERRLEIQGKHALAGEKLFKIAMEYIDENKELFTPAVMLKYLETAIKLERVTLGMNPKGESQSMPLQLNINNVNATGTKGDVNVDSNTGDTAIEDDRERLIQVLNVMNQIGALSEEPSIECDYTEVTDE